MTATTNVAASVR